MKVIATQQGFFGNRIVEKDEVFDVDSKAKASWFTPVEKEAKADAAAKAKADAAAKAKADAETKANELV